MIEVRIEPTAHSERDGYDLGIWQYGHGWIKSDLTLTELRQVRDAITASLDRS